MIVIIRKTALIYKNKKTVMFVIKMKACSNGVMVDAYRLSNTFLSLLFETKQQKTIIKK